MGTTGIVVILAGLAVLAGIIITVNDSGETEAVAQRGAGALETAAENRAITETAVVTEAAAERAELLDETDDVMQDTMEKKDEMMKDADVSTAPAADTTPTVAAEPAPTTVAAAGMFSDYDESKLTENGTNVLFFHAEWCPSCKGLERDLTNNLSAIPEGVNILKLDYDSETELKKKYGVVRQHTLVVVDANGSEIKKLTGLTNTLDQVVGQL